MNTIPNDDLLVKAKQFNVLSSNEDIIEPVIYHYCSIEAFMSIIRSGEIWASHYSSMNDYSESHLFYYTLYEVARLKKNVNNSEKIELFLKNFEISLKDYYIASFSSNPDLLNQWYMYADKGKGVCIGFITDSFNVKHEIPSYNILTDKNIGIFNVSYQNKQYEELASDLIDLVINDFESLIPQNIERLSLVMKHESFVNEKEVRIVEVQFSALSMNPDVPGMQTFCPGEHYGFRVKNGNSIVSYRKFPFRKKGSEQSIHSIWLGPECNMDIKELNLFLNGTKTKLTDTIYHSNCPFRL